MATKGMKVSFRYEIDASYASVRLSKLESLVRRTLGDVDLFDESVNKRIDKLEGGMKW